jgi:maltose/moltooligosaccharide transporter
MKIQPTLSFWQIWNMSFGFLGIQFGFALQNANVSRIFETLGAKVEAIPILWIAAPVTGLIIQPIIGHMSDRTWNRLGRRRPYFLTGAILASIALIIMPNSPALWMAAGMLWIMDASINVSMEPFRAFVGDMLPDEQRTRGFAMQSLFIGTGAFIASWLPYIFTNWFHIPNTAHEGEIPLSVQYSFYIGGAVFLLAVLWTIISTKEYSPEQLTEFEATRRTQKSANAGTTEDLKIIKPKTFLNNGIIWILAGLVLSLPVYFYSLEKELYIFSFGISVYGLLQMLTAYFRVSDTSNGLTDIITDLYNMPKTMKQLAIVQFFSWFALFAMWIYTTSAVTSHIYGTSDTESELYNEGANWVGGMFGYYNLFAAIFSFLLPVIARYSSRKITHSIALISGCLGLTSFYIIKDPDLLIFSMVGVGLAWSSILAMPYAILTGSLPQKKMGVYMGIFNFFIVIPQILAASILGFLTRHLFNNQAIYALVLGGVSMLVAAVAVLFVEDTHKSPNTGDLSP